MRRLRLAEEDLRGGNPRLIVVSLVGYGQSGPYARKPAYDDLMQGISGVASLFTSVGSEQPLYVPETLTGMELLDNFRQSHMQMAFVIDEYGEVQGLVTLQDLVEAITGEFRPRDPQTSWAVQREDRSWLLDGHIPVPELKDRLELTTVPEEDRGRYQTLSGMMMLLTGRLPKVADSVNWEGWHLEIVDMDGKTIDKVLASRLPETQPQDGTDPARP